VTRRQILAAVAVVIWCILIAVLIKWRSAPPPPPNIPIPGDEASPAPGGQ
jgi:hypothetical protein